LAKGSGAVIMKTSATNNYVILGGGVGGGGGVGLMGVCVLNPACQV